MTRGWLRISRACRFFPSLPSGIDKLSENETISIFPMGLRSKFGGFENMATITVNQSGQITLSDERLLELEASYVMAGAGPDTVTNSSICDGSTNADCINSFSCKKTKNTNCSNSVACAIDDGIG